GCRAKLVHHVCSISGTPCTADCSSTDRCVTTNVFPANTDFKFKLCVDEDGNHVCDNVWSSKLAENTSDGIPGGSPHLKLTERPLPGDPTAGRLFELAWEASPFSQTADFADYIANVR